MFCLHIRYINTDEANCQFLPNLYILRSMKTLVFDIDDTLTTSGSWVRLNKAAGVTDTEDYQLYIAFTQGQIDYQAWLSQLASLYKERNQLTPDKAAGTLKDFTLRDGVTETFAFLHQHGYRTVLLSGGFRGMVEAVQGIVNADTSIALSDIVFDATGNFDYFISHGEEGAAKVRMLETYCKERQLKPSDCVAVGDSSNDVALFDLTGNGVTFSWCKPEVKARAKYVIADIRDFPALLDIL